MNTKRAWTATTPMCVTIVCLVVVVAGNDQYLSLKERNIEKPKKLELGTPSFVPRLGKREDTFASEAERICGQDMLCYQQLFGKQLLDSASDRDILSAYSQKATSAVEANARLVAMLTQIFDKLITSDNYDSRKSSKYEDFNNMAHKRVTFTPRVGR
ncbi:hypothetical protein GZH46_01502 [Fragariocoptes setiger]|uniref:Uncharacterized protein n=1 Tax=Fragariocoptes setiger TaxID=1670756 RepID=A0ABQ7S9E4_9ACAR|nr:hypothetical protein GZH46_01502 [Fragariocoptes setiger]